MHLVDDFIISQMREQNLPGLCLGVIWKGEVVKLRGYGVANVELKVLAEPVTMYKLGSISKHFIAAAIMLLVENDNVQIEDEIGRHFYQAPDTWKGIRIKHLLSHTSGIVRDAPGFDPYRVQSVTELIEATFSLPLLFRPGDSWSYSNVGYYLLAEIISRVSGQPFSDYISERVFKPAEMCSTRTTSVTDIIPNRASSYLRQDGTTYNAGDLLAMRPSGAFVSNIVDLANWDTALRTSTVLNIASREQMQVPIVLNDGSTYPYGFGWELSDVNGHRLVHHGGALWCFRTEFARYIDDELTVIVLINLRDGDARRLALRVAGFYVMDLVPSDDCIAMLNAPVWLESFSE